MRILEEFYYGNIDPQERFVKKNGEFARAAALSVRNEEEMMKTLTEQQKEQFEKCMAVQTEMNGIGEREAFIRGFKLGLRFMAEAYDITSGEFED